MELWSLFHVACMPIIEVLFVGLLGALLATDYINLLPSEARSYTNKLVFAVFTPALVFASLAKSVTLQDIISWWFMPVNIGLTFLIGGFLGWIAVKILRPDHQLEGLIISSCSAGNLGNMLLILIPTICNQDDNPFGDPSTCNVHGLSYVSFSMALGGIFIWTIAYGLMKRSAAVYGQMRDESKTRVTDDNKSDVYQEVNIRYSEIGEGNKEQQIVQIPLSSSTRAGQCQSTVPLLPRSQVHRMRMYDVWEKVKQILHKIAEELLTPPTLAAVVGLIVGAMPWLKSLFIGNAAPLRVIHDSMLLLGDGTVPCVTLILGGNLIQGLRKSAVKPSAIIAVACVRYVMLPLFGIAVVKTAGELGFLPRSPLYRFVLLVQFTLPPAMSISTMAQLFGVGQVECSVVFMWTYLVAAFALTFWSVTFMWILS